MQQNLLYSKIRQSIGSILSAGKHTTPQQQEQMYEFQREYTKRVRSEEETRRGTPTRSHLRGLIQYQSNQPFFFILGE